jgi:hypothetical protein
MPQVKAFRDVQVAAPLLYELHQSYSLENIAERAGLPGKNEVGLREAAAALHLHPKKDIWRMAARHVGPYATDDAIRPLEILAIQDKQIDEDRDTEVLGYGVQAASDSRSHDAARYPGQRGPACSGGRVDQASRGRGV